ncbi:MAG: cytochrome hydroxylase [Amycolatopsis sp.]|uniref:cytochrome P450 n=1 Tax=Amycolatopsis sp. TaxID=37632 RepID=UPI00261AACE0|nr:cytochrome P450 [Amycolatopsis sp.]MCU1680343.1 cytochrome hydroxylase [Amycolatopsis sp.]
MTKSLPEAAPLPTEHPPGCPFDPPAELTRLREENPVSALAYDDGHEGWLVTSRTLVRAVLADKRFSARLELMRNPFPGTASGDLPPAQPGDLTGVDAPEHTRYRRLLIGQFTVRRMRQLTARLEEITHQHLDAMERQGSSADLVTAFAHPVPALMICELLGVPYASREKFQKHAAVLAGSGQEVFEAFAALREFVVELVRAKRAEPTDDLLSDLTTTDLTDEELTNIGVLLLGAGLETTANVIALGTFALLRHPGQFALLRDEPDLADQAVEELLRYLSVVPLTVRTALEDVELGGQLIKSGDTVSVSLAAANRDPAQFPDPDSLDIRRASGGQVAFGHGIHQCLGQQLARVELRVALPALLRRFPTLRLAVPPEDVSLGENLMIRGLQQLPVAWDAL